MSKKWQELSRAVKLGFHHSLDNREQRCRDLGDTFFTTFQAVRDTDDKSQYKDIYRHYTGHTEQRQLELQDEADYRGEYLVDDIVQSLVQSVIMSQAQQSEQDTLLDNIKDVFDVSEEDLKTHIDRAKNAFSPLLLTHQGRMSQITAQGLPDTSVSHPHLTHCFCNVDMIKSQPIDKQRTPVQLGSDSCVQTDRTLQSQDGHVMFGGGYSFGLCQPSQCQLCIEMWSCLSPTDQAKHQQQQASEATEADNTVGPLSEFGDESEAPMTESVAAIIDTSRVQARRGRRRLRSMLKGELNKFKRRLKRKQSSTLANPAPATKHEVVDRDLHLIGRGILDIESLQLNRDQEVTVPLFDLDGKHAGCVTAVLELSGNDLRQVVSEARARHRVATHRIIKYKAMQDEQIAQSRVDKSYGETEQLPSEPIMGDVLLSRHASWCGLSMAQAALDRFCAVMELNAKRLLSLHTILACFETAAEQCRNASILADEDVVRFVAALHAVYSFSFPVVSAPVDNMRQHEGSGTRDELVNDVKMHVKMLKILASLEIWQRSMNFDSTSDPEELARRESMDLSSPIVQRARELMQQHASLSYLSIKATLVAEFGTSEFAEHKEAIQHLLLLLNWETKAEDNPYLVDDDPVTKKLRKILASVRSGHEATLAAVEQSLISEFGEEAVNKKRSNISGALLWEAHVRLKQSADKPVDTSGKREAAQLEAALKKYFELKCHEVFKRCAGDQEEDFEGKDIVQAVRMTRCMTVDLTDVHDNLDGLYKELLGVELLRICAQTYDAFIAKIAQGVLATHHTEGTGNVSTVLFELYFAVRSFAEKATSMLDLPPPAHKLRYSHVSSKSCEKPLSLQSQEYFRWFEPLVHHWMDLAKINGRKWIDNSIALDDWKPFNSDWQFSTSALDVFRALFEILDFWDKIDWPDQIGAEDYLFDQLASAVCTCVQYYAASMRDRAMKAMHPVDEKGRPQPHCDNFDVPSVVCVALNNLRQAEHGLQLVEKNMHVDEIAERHMKEALKANVGHTGAVKPHRSLRRFQKTLDAIGDAAKSIAEDVAQGLSKRIHQDIERICYTCPSSNELITDHVAKCCEAIFAPPSLYVDDEGMPAVNSLPSSRASSVNTDVSSLDNSSRSTDSRYEITDDGYLQRNFIFIVQHVSSPEIQNKVLGAVWRRVLATFNQIILGEIDSPISKSSNQISFFVMALLREYRHFFLSDGNGLPLGIVDDIQDEVVAPALTYSKLPVPRLITEFFAAASEEQGQPILKALGIDAESKLMPVGESGRGSLEICMRFVTLPYKALHIRVERGWNIPTKNTYLVVRVQPNGFSSEAFKHKSSQVQKTTSPLFNEDVICPVQFDSVAVHIRLQAKGKLRLRDDIIVGEILVPLKHLRGCPDTDIRARLPIHDVKYSGRPGYLMRLIELRVKDGDQQVDDNAVQFVKKYQHRVGLDLE